MIFVMFKYAIGYEFMYCYRPEPILPHFRPVSLVSLTIQPVPLFTKARYVCYILNISKLNY